MIQTKDRVTTWFLFSVILTVVSCFYGNILISDKDVILDSFKILLVSVSIQILLFSVVKKTGNWLLGLLLVFLGLAGCAYLTAYALVGRVVGLAIVGVVVVRFRKSFHVHPSNLPSPIIASILIGLFCIMCDRYTSFNMFGRLSAGDVHQDTLFHASIASMVKTYGVFSTGLSGTVPVSYHVFSHVLFAGISNLSGVSVFQTYGIATTVVFAPIFVILISAISAGIGNANRIYLKSVVSVACLSMLPVWLGAWGVWLHNWIASESNLVGLCILFAVILSCIDELHSDGLSSKYSVLGYGTAAFLSTCSKGPIGIASILSLFALFMARRTASNFLKVGVTTVGFLSALLIVAGDAGASVRLLSFLVTHTKGGHRLLALFQHEPNLVGVSLGLFVLLLSITIHFSGPFFLLILLKSKATKSLQTYWRTFIVCTVTVGLLAVLLLFVGGGSESYFSNIPWYFCIPVISAYTVDRVCGLTKKQQIAVGIAGFFVTSITLFKNRQLMLRTMAVQRICYTKNDFIDSLGTYRSAEYDEFLSISNNLPKGENPIQRCTARPFVYPAVSEKAWTGLIESNSIPCTYDGYGYRSYGDIIEKLRRK